ncbi:MFS transporter [uncultured Nevskia sp.]|uniref:MFS transporter n=1 Tax=uncultured Nevskia sp. TaxID=228950 RepID=UPI0026009831|nr:MFS transporter [uncultured Nevskia sp.]
MNTSPMTPRARFRAIFSGSIGNLVEYYDWYAYSAFALYFSKAFFPGSDPTAQLLNTAGIFALGFFMRPLGGWLMGSLADRKGRRAAMLLSVLMMCAGSLTIALTPGYAQIGVAAPIILVICRLVQGLSLGGEYGISATYLSEVASKEHRGFWSSFQYVTLILGQLTALALLISLQRWLLTPAELDAWGWRIPFVIGGLLALAALWLRRGLHETESFAKQAAPERAPLRRLLREHPREVLTVVGLTLGGTLAFYTYTTYMQKFLVNTGGFSKDDATLISAAALTVYMLLQPLFGALSDKIGRRPLLIFFGVGGSLGTVPLLGALATASDAWTAFALMLTGLVIVSGYTAVNAIVKAELFPVAVRALGVGLPYALTVSLFGGTAEYVALWFKGIGSETGFYWYVSAMIAVSLAVYLRLPETRNRSRLDQD